MRTLTIEDIKANPNAVLSQPLPEFPSRYLLLLAQLAATCARAIAEETLAEFQETPENAMVANPDVHKLLNDWSRAHRKIGEICFILEDNFSVPMHDFNLSRNTQATENVLVRVKEYLLRLLR